MIRLIFVTFILLGAFSFGLKNAEQEVTLEYYFGLSSPPITVYKIVLWTFLLTVFAVTLLLLPEWIKMRVKLRHQRKMIERAEKELNQFNQERTHQKNHA